MVRVRDAFCIDRYEASLVDDATSTALSPYYPPERAKALYVEKSWREKIGSGTALERATRLPELPASQRQQAVTPRALSRRDVIPQAYASMRDAETACRNADKRLCTATEWKTACRGEQDRDFPYGDSYQQGTCNIFREAHPGILLWDDPTIHHTDPRFNLMRSKTGPLLRKTGATPACASKWGDDAVFDMVGNVDEWIDDPDGTFLGGFYARSKKDGCQSSVGSHVPTYADYSTGFRCCLDLPAPQPAAL